MILATQSTSNDSVPFLSFRTCQLSIIAPESLRPPHPNRNERRRSGESLSAMFQTLLPRSCLVLLSCLTVHRNRGLPAFVIRRLGEHNEGVTRQLQDEIQARYKMAQHLRRYDEGVKIEKDLYEP